VLDLRKLTLMQLLKDRLIFPQYILLGIQQPLSMFNFIDRWTSFIRYLLGMKTDQEGRRGSRSIKGIKRGQGNQDRGQLNFNYKQIEAK